jgi:hypothetical protein
MELFGIISENTAKERRNVVADPAPGGGRALTAP